MYQYFFTLYLVSTLSLTSLTSIYAKGIKGIENFTYYNNILITISTALLSANLTYLYLNHTNIPDNAVLKLLFIAFILISLVFSFIMISSKEYDLCTPIMKRTFQGTFIMNIVLMVCAIIIIYYSQKTNNKPKVKRDAIKANIYKGLLSELASEQPLSKPTKKSSPMADTRFRYTQTPAQTKSPGTSPGTSYSARSNRATYSSSARTKSPGSQSSQSSTRTRSPGPQFTPSSSPRSNRSSLYSSRSKVRPTPSSIRPDRVDRPRPSVPGMFFTPREKPRLAPIREIR